MRRQVAYTDRATVACREVSAKINKYTKLKEDKIYTFRPINIVCNMTKDDTTVTQITKQHYSRLLIG
jgi:hypothetical protein